MIQTVLEAGLRQTMRRVVRPVLSPLIGIGLQRRLTRQAYRSSTPPSDCEFSHGLYGNIPVSHVNYGQPDKGVLLYFHGGGYTIGSAETHRGITGHLAKTSGCTVVVPDYRLAPEHPYPAALEDAEAVYKALLGDGFSPANIALAGDSAGGGLALALAMKLRDDGKTLPGSLTVFSPWTDLTHTALSSPDMEPVLQRSWVEKNAELYCGDLTRTTPYISPVYGDLSGLPPLLIQAGSQEILLNDSIRLSDRARAQDVDTTLEIYNSLWHVFQIHASQLDRAREALAVAGAHIKAHLAT
ncbi:MAG: alpha/beta hydrolase [Marinobacter sp.]|uniref:alpha/beta hydrolase n=1 Tax=Marinobacter sp. TaxID=50741 RepID=UPI0034A01625